jgi:predicted amidophosphoribosyltransferase
MRSPDEVIKYIFQCLSALVFGHRCVACGCDVEPDQRFLCPACLEDFPLTHFWQWDGNPAEKRMWKLAGVEHACSLFFYRPDSPYRKLIIAIKYHGNTSLAEWLGYILGKQMALSGRYDEVCAVIPVPLHRRRLRKRGYNQAECVARGIAAALSDSMQRVVPVLPEALKRSRYTKTQTKLKEADKSKNVQGAFLLPKRIELPREAVSARDGLFHVLLVDDVLTTGATLAACVGPLFTQRDLAVSVATLGFTE